MKKYVITKQQWRTTLGGWDKLGAELGFDPDTVSLEDDLLGEAPTDERFLAFMAVPILQKQ